MGGVVKGVTGALGLTADEKAGRAEAQRAAQLQARAVRELEKLGVPSIEAQKVVLEQPELVLSTLEERLGPSAFEEIVPDRQLVESELRALSDLQLAGEEGFTTEDRARMEALRSRVAQDEKARQASILQQMAQRGTLDSGAQLAAQLGSSQAATQRAAQEALQMGAQQAQARRGALSQAADLSSRMQGRQFQQAAQKASAKDRISQFNTAVSARDTAARRQHEQQRANLANKQQLYNKGLVQQQFLNELSKATGTVGALGNQAQQAMTSAGMQAHAAQQEAAAIRGIATAAGTMAMSDKRNKEDIKAADSDRLQEMFDKAKPYKYDYKDDKYGDESYHGLMAQDLEKSAEGKKYVLDTPQGKMVDYGKMGGALAAGISDLNKRLEKLEDNKYQDGGYKNVDQLEKLLDNSVVDNSSNYTTDAEKEAFEKGIVGSGQISQKEFDKARSEEKTKPKSFDYKEDKVSPYQIGNINPNDIGRMVSSQMQAPSSLEKARQAIMSGSQYAQGGMAYEDGGEGTIIPGESYTGDDLPDRINSGEMVLNLDQQDHIEDLLKELAERRRADEMVDNGDAEVNEYQQETLMDIARGEASPEDLDPESDIVEEYGSTADELESLLGEFSTYQDGGISTLRSDLGDFSGGDIEPNYSSLAGGPLDLADITGSLATYDQPEPMMSTSTMDEQEEPDYSKMMSVGEPAELPMRDEKVEREVNDIVESPNAPKDVQKDTKAPKDEDTVDKELQDARKTDMWVNLIQDLDNALGHFDAANPYAKLTPIQRKHRKSQMEEKLMEARKIAANEKYKRDALELQRSGQESAAEDRKLAREERAETRQERREQREKEEERRQRSQARQFKGDIYKVRKDFLADPVVKELRKQDVSFDQAESLLDAMDRDNKVAVGALGTKMARAMGEVGVLTDADVVRYIQRNDVSGQVKDFFSRKFKGKVSDLTSKDLQDITNIMKMGATKRISRLREDYVDAAYENFGKDYGMTREEVEKRMGAKGKELIEKKSNRNEQALKWLEANPDHPKADAVRQKLGL